MSTNSRKNTLPLGREFIFRTAALMLTVGGGCANTLDPSQRHIMNLARGGIENLFALCSERGTGPKSYDNDTTEPGDNRCELLQSHRDDRYQLVAQEVTHNDQGPLQHKMEVSMEGIYDQSHRQCSEWVRVEDNYQSAYVKDTYKTGGDDGTEYDFRYSRYRYVSKEATTIVEIEVSKPDCSDASAICTVTAATQGIKGKPPAQISFHAPIETCKRIFEQVRGLFRRVE